MSAGATQAPSRRPSRRVRHEVRDSLTVMAFSAISSCGVAGLLTLLVRN